LITSEIQIESDSTNSNSAEVVAPEYSTSMRYFPNGNIPASNGIDEGI